MVESHLATMQLVEFRFTIVDGPSPPSLFSESKEETMLSTQIIKEISEILTYCRGRI